MLDASCRKVMTRAAEWRGQKARVMDALFEIDVIMFKLKFMHLSAL